MYSSGLRVSEVIHLHYHDVSRTRMHIHIRDLKKEWIDTPFCLNEILIFLLNIGFSVAGQWRFFFLNHLSDQYLTISTVEQVMRRSIAEAGLPKNVTPSYEQSRVTINIINCKTGVYGANLSICKECGCF